MFSARRRLSVNRAYNKTFVEKLGQNLREAEYDSITVKLPHNIVGMEKNEITLEEFLTRERNYPSVILVARSTSRREIIKILFVNISTKAFFVDDTFPSGHSEPPELFIQSPDPARVYALSGFFAAYFDKEGRKTSTALKTLFFYTALIALLTEIFTFFSRGQGAVTFAYPSYASAGIIDFAILIAGLFLLFRGFETPRGLYVNEMPRRSIWSLLNLALRGQLMDNPLVALLITVVGGIVTALLLRYFGLP